MPLTNNGTVNFKGEDRGAFGSLNVSQEEVIADLQFPYGVNSENTVTTLTGSGSVTHSAPFAVLSTTAAASSSARLDSQRAIRYTTGQGVFCKFTAIFTTGVAGSHQHIGFGDNTTDGLFFGYNGATFGIVRYQATNATHVAQSAWNVDPMDGTGPSGMTLDPTKLNVYRIRMQWLGGGMIFFDVEADGVDGGMFVTVHKIAFTNANTNTSLNNPTLPLSAHVENTTNDTAIVLKTPSMSLGVEGESKTYGVDWAATGSEEDVSTTLYPILSIRGATNFNSIASRLRAILNEASVSVNAVTGASTTLVQLIVNPTTLTNASWTAVDATESGVEYDTSATAVGGGRLAFARAVSASGSVGITGEVFNEQLSPGQVWTLAAVQQAGGGTIDVSAAFSWKELI